MSGADLVAIGDALNWLSQFDELQSRIVEMRFFGDLLIEEIGEVLCTSRSTVEARVECCQSSLPHGRV
jgi:DNA-directed RNA polymerase specialized sigma subunit